MKNRRCAGGVDLEPVCEMYLSARKVAREHSRPCAFSRKPLPEFRVRQLIRWRQVQKLDGRLLPGAAHGGGGEGGYLGCLVPWNRNPPKRCLVRWIEIPVNHHPEKVARSPNATTQHYFKAMRMPSDKAREKLLSDWKCSDFL